MQLVSMQLVGMQRVSMQLVSMQLVSRAVCVRDRVSEAGAGAGRQVPWAR